MRYRMPALALCAATFVAASVSLYDADAGGGGAHQHRSGLEVHEWGTFTSMQGVDGVSLEGLHHEEEALPGFVHNTSNTEAQFRSSEGKGGTLVRRVTQKMETPVIYFYADRKMRARVTVQYSRGMISEWFPAAAEHSISYWGGVAADEAVDMATVSSSSIRWDVDLTPASQAKPSGIPAVHADDPWSFARRVRAAYVKDRGSREAEHYLFYRGLGAHQLPVSVTTDDGGALVVKNDTGASIPFAALLEVGPKGARFQSLKRVGVSAKANLTQLAWRPLDDEVAKLKSVLAARLEATGLFPDEAHAMVRTWSRQWFTTEGTRLIYVVPRKVTDELLPITISPRPDRMVRTLVGRVEYITPATLAEIESAVADRFSTTRSRRVHAIKRLGRLGRFLEPHLRHLGRNASADRTRENAAELLRQVIAASRSAAAAGAKTGAKGAQAGVKAGG